MPAPTAIPEAIRSCYNGTGSDIAAGVFVKLSGAYPGVSLPAGATDTIYGVTMSTIKAGKYGDVMIRGKALVTSSAATTLGGKLTVDAAGKVLDWTAAGGRSVVAIGLKAAAGANEVFEAELAGPGTFDIS
jgi:hypothetical protein